MTLELAKTLLGFIAPPIVTNNFELVSIQEKGDALFLNFEENKNLVPIELSDRSFRLSGFENKLELHTFPQKGEPCYLNIRRRRWVDKESGKSYSNQYDFHEQGMKTTRELGAFLKKK